ncbi:hypothetical protein DFP72DRAFT_854119 [Ephemerocybe angulata]|uniref:Uncharacterized protein n=1 Tax=Ephemerocybe angulata TaxID=980116 RepID=A0A8H6M0F6_9AGAR|nr:hypothetical protein DFP72DRAFT_854119 [Tulosesus angulatus]
MFVLIKSSPCPLLAVSLNQTLVVSLIVSGWTRSEIASPTSKHEVSKQREAMFTSAAADPVGSRELSFSESTQSRDSPPLAHRSHQPSIDVQKKEWPCPALPLDARLVTTSRSNFHPSTLDSSFSDAPGYSLSDDCKLSVLRKASLMEWAVALACAYRPSARYPYEHDFSASRILLAPLVHPACPVMTVARFAGGSVHDIDCDGAVVEKEGMETCRKSIRDVVQGGEGALGKWDWRRTCKAVEDESSGAGGSGSDAVFGVVGRPKSATVLNIEGRRWGTMHPLSRWEDRMQGSYTRCWERWRACGGRCSFRLDISFARAQRLRTRSGSLEGVGCGERDGGSGGIGQLPAGGTTMQGRLSSAEAKA